MRKFVAKSVLAIVSVGALVSLHAEQVSDYAVQVSATVSKNPPSIQLSWPAPTVTPNGYRIYRKSETDTSFGGAIASLPNTATSWTDTNVAVGTAYEYKLDTNGSYGTGFIFAGIEVPLIENRGKVVLLVDNTMSQPLSGELARLQQDLTGDGWTVIRHDVGRSDALPSIKQLVQADYNADQTNVKALFIFGHVPVPYSGDINPDGHAIHKGAWPADTYFANIDGGWSDNSVYDTSASARTDNVQANWNKPGDGKFDQSSLPGDAKLQVGRVDLWNMGYFGDETALLRNYLNKDHNFRTGSINAQRRGILCDNFGTMNGEAFAANGWRAFPALMGPNVTDAVPDENSFVNALKSNTYLWGYGCGPGYWFSVGNVLTTDDVKNSDPHCVFCMLFGSFFGDWDCQNNMMRSILCTNSTGLATMWAGRPNWYVHHMALGKNIGYAAKLSQNNSGLYPSGQAARQIHVSLLGDPTLRMHIVLPPSNVQGSGNTITWSGSADGSVLGYHVYRSSAATGPFSRITSNLVNGTSYTDNTASPGTYTYMVRAVKLETSGGGTYFNPSEGAFGTVQIGSGGGGGSNGPPVITSAASASPNPAAAGQNVTFSVAAQDPDNDPLTTTWNFGDGSSSTSNQHTYNSAGNYTATASIDDGHGHTVTSSVAVTVNPAGGGGGGGGTFSITQPLSANPGAPGAGQTVTFSVGASATIATASYDYGDGSNGTGNTHVYASAGQYNAIVNVADAQGHTAFSTLLLTVSQASSGPFAITQPLSANPGSPAAGQMVTFSVAASNPIATASYDYGDNSHGSDSTHVYASPGQYNAIVNVADAQGHTAFSTLLLTIAQGSGNTNHPPVIATALAASPNPATAGQAVTFSVKASDADNDTLSYAYTYGDGASGSAASHTYAKAGTYSASVTVSDGKGGSVTSSTSVVVNAASNGGGSNGGSGGTGSGGGDNGAGGSGGATPPSNPLTLAALNIKLNLKAQNADTLSLSGAVAIPAGFNPANSTLTLTVGGVSESFQLNAAGTAQSKTASVHVHVRTVKKAVPAQNAAVTIALKGSFSALSAAGIDAAHNGQKVTLPVSIAYAGATDAVDATVLVNGKSKQAVTARLSK